MTAQQVSERPFNLIRAAAYLRALAVGNEQFWSKPPAALSYLAQHCSEAHHGNLRTVIPQNFIEPSVAVKKLSATPLKHDAVRKKRKTGRGKMSAQIERPPALASESRAVFEVWWLRMEI